MKYLMYVVAIGLCMMHTGLMAQRVFVTDQENKKPLAGATWKTNLAEGSTDAEGALMIPQNSEWLELSHIGYYALKLNAARLGALKDNEWLYMTPNTGILIDPVVVYSVKSLNPTKLNSLSQHDWLHHDAGQVLTQIEGLSAIRKSMSYAADPVFRGFKNEQIQIITNGVATTLTSCPSRMDAPSSQIPLSLFSKVMIAKGPHHFRYGPATGAVINFENAAPEFSTAGTTTSGRISAGYETNGEVYRTEGIAKMHGKKLELTANAAYSRGHAYKDGEDSLVPSAFSRGTVGLGLQWKATEQGVFSAGISRNFTRNADFPTLMMDQISDDALIAQAGYKHTPGGRFYKEWNTHAFYSSVDHVMSNKLRKNVMMSMTTEGLTKSHGARTEMVFEKAGRRKTITGLDYKEERMADTLWQNASVRRAGIFVDHSMHLEKNLNLNFSFRTDVVKGDADYPFKKFQQIYGNDLSRNDVNLSLSAGLSKQINPYLQAGIWLGRGVRSASVAERFINSNPIGLDGYEVFGNPQLKPEANNQLDLIAGYEKGKTRLRFNAFYSLATNYIYSVLNPNIPKRNMMSLGVRQYVNLDKVSRLGFEAGWDQVWFDALRHQLSMSYTRAENEATNSPLAEIAPFEVRYMLYSSFMNERLKPFAGVRYSGKQNRIAADYGEKETDAFCVAEAGVQFLLVKNLSLQANVSNLFNTTYREHLSRFINKTRPMYAPGRSLILNLSYQF